MGTVNRVAESTSEDTRRRLLTICSRAHVERSLSVQRQVKNFIPKTNTEHFLVIDWTTFHGCVIPLSEYATRGSLCFCLHGKGSRIRTLMFAAIAKPTECASAFMNGA